MRIINYYYGYLFDCSIHGKIIVSPKEWQAITDYLRRARFEHKFTLKNDLERGIKTKDGRLYNVRVTATEKAVSKFKHSGAKFKRANYMFLVKK